MLVANRAGPLSDLSPTARDGDALLHSVLSTLCLDGVWDLGSAEGFLDYVERRYGEARP